MSKILTHLFLYGYVNLTLDMRNARPAFTNPSDAKDDA